MKTPLAPYRDILTELKFEIEWYANFPHLTRERYEREEVGEGRTRGVLWVFLEANEAEVLWTMGRDSTSLYDMLASSMAAALTATAYDADSRVVENAAESALEHHLGMTCDPVAGYVQVPCIERCAFGAVKAWTAFMIATNEIGWRHRVDLDTTIKTLADTGKDMSTKYKETSEAGLAANLVLC